MDGKAPLIRSGVFDANGSVRDYRAERIGDMFVERVVWGAELPGEPSGWAGPGHIWYRFWTRLSSRSSSDAFPLTGPCWARMSICVRL